MSRLFGAFGVYLAILVANLSTGASAQDAFVTRVEPRPFYGATITIEEGVRVFRPLPPTQQIIINPSQSPLNISTNTTVDRRTTSANSGVRDENGDGNGYANGDTGNGGYSEPTTSYPNYGSALPFNDRIYGSHNGREFGSKGRRLRGFAPHGVRVNGQHTPYSAGHYGRTNHEYFQPRALTSFGQHGGKARSHALHNAPMGYGSPYHGYAHGGSYQNGYRSGYQHGGHVAGRLAQAQRLPMPHVKVYRPHPSPSPQMVRAPIGTHVAPMAPRPPHGPAHAPAGHAAPRHAGHGQAAPAGGMGMGMGRR